MTARGYRCLCGTTIPLPGACGQCADLDDEYRGVREYIAVVCGDRIVWYCLGVGCRRVRRDFGFCSDSCALSIRIRRAVADTPDTDDDDDRQGMVY